MRAASRTCRCARDCYNCFVRQRIGVVAIGHARGGGRDVTADEAIVVIPHDDGFHKGTHFGLGERGAGRFHSKDDEGAPEAEVDAGGAAGGLRAYPVNSWNE